jgi:UDP-N-acetylmuramate dehydrogenase
MQFQQNVPLAPLTTFQIGGPARWFAEAASEEDIAHAVEFAERRGLRLLVLGGGSNLLVSDAGFPGLILRIALKGIVRRDGPAGAAEFSVAAGEAWDGFVAHAVAEGCAGVECLSGIPGSAGATPVQNVGAYGQEVSQTILRVRVYDRTQSRFLELPAAECGFAYRRSIFNSTLRERYIVSRVDFALRPDGAPMLAYAELRRHFAAGEGRPGLREVREAVRSIRAGKGMLIVEGDPDSRSAGSFFKNPVVPEEKLDRIAQAWDVSRDSIPHYPAGPGRVKLPAAWLVEQAGFHKGYALGAAGISSRHALALVNRGGATASEVAALRDCIVEAVERRFGVVLEPEPVWVA